MSKLDLDAISQKWLQPCGPCDGGLPMSCSHPDEDYRNVILALVNRVRELEVRERVDKAIEDVLNEAVNRRGA